MTVCCRRSPLIKSAMLYRYTMNQKKIASNVTIKSLIVWRAPINELAFNVMPAISLSPYQMTTGITPLVSGTSVGMTFKTRKGSLQTASNVII
jgi:hypothetical protein